MTFVYFHLPFGKKDNQIVSKGTTYEQYELQTNEMWSVGIVEADSLDEAQKYMNDYFGNGTMMVAEMPKPFFPRYKHHHLAANNRVFIK